MRMSRQIATFCMALALATACWLNGCSRKPAEVTIGAVLPMTGNSAKYGSQMKEGIDLAVEEICALGEGSSDQLRVIIEDGQADATRSITAFRKLVALNRPVAVLSGFSGVVLSLAPVAAESEIPLLNCGATSPEIEGASDYTFSDIPNAKQEATFLAREVLTRFGCRKVAIFWQNNDAGIGMKNFFQKQFVDLGGTIVADESQNVGETDFRAPLLKIKTADPDAVFMPTYAKEFGLAIKQAREMGLKCQFFGYAATEVQEAIDIAGDAAEGVVYSYYAYDQVNPSKRTKAFLDAFVKKYSHPPNLYSATFYDGVYLVYEAILHGAKSGKEVKEYWASMPEFEGASGNIRFTKTGAVSTAIRLKTIKNGQFAELGN